jgi:hypothetical protein
MVKISPNFCGLGKALGTYRKHFINRGDNYETNDIQPR